GIVPISATAQSVIAWDGRNWRDGRAQSWHLTIERELPWKTALRVSYIGDHGRDLEQRFSINNREDEYNDVRRPALPPPSQRDLTRPTKDGALGNGGLNSTGYSNSHSGQIELERRFSNGIAFQWFYTYNRSLSTSDVGGFTSGNVSINS